MKVITDNNVKQFILDRIDKVYIGFNDNIEVTLKHITDYDIDLDKIEYSTIEFANALSDKEMINHFKGNSNSKIIYVKIKATGITLDDEVSLSLDDKWIDVLYDIPCDMVIRKLRIDGGVNECSRMVVELEGAVK
jgi:hypothetical protein